MRAYYLVTCLLASACAFPEASYAHNAHQLKPHAHQELPAEHNFANFGAPSNQYLTPLDASAAPASYSTNSLQNLDATSAVQLNEPLSLSQRQPQQQHADSYNIAHQHSTYNHNADGYAYAPQETTVHKHIYVHVPPKDFEDEDVITPHVRHEAAPKQKHYKIVFIKAPAAPSVRPPVIPPPPQNEEKTLIYVLHKKPELQPDIVIPTAAPTQPSKPEVYFIKYKSRKEEAPVYGPPPAALLLQPRENQQAQQYLQHQHEEQQQQPQQQEPLFLDMEPRHIEVPSDEYGAPTNDNFAIAAPNALDASAPLTTQQPAIVEKVEEKFNAENLTAVYGTPEEPQATLAAPSNQYLEPTEQQTQTMAPIVVEDTHEPTTEYGAPNKFFLKKKK